MSPVIPDDTFHSISGMLRHFDHAATLDSGRGNYWKYRKFLPWMEVTMMSEQQGQGDMGEDLYELPMRSKHNI